ncbi:MAG: hypothetical protein ACI8S6_005031 [Myxococcota bacterium]|jgi:hypothetical protein
MVTRRGFVASAFGRVTVRTPSVTGCLGCVRVQLSTEPEGPLDGAGPPLGADRGEALGGLDATLAGQVDNGLGDVKLDVVGLEAGGLQAKDVGRRILGHLARRGDRSVAAPSSQSK